MALYKIAGRLKRLAPYPFAELARKRLAAVAKGRDVIDLGIGDPDQPAPHFVTEALARHAADRATHRYGVANGDPAFRRSIAEFMQQRFGVALDPDAEICATIGSKEAIAHFPLAFVDPGDLTLVPDPSYPVYAAGTVLAGGRPVSIPLLSGRGFIPDLNAIAPRIAASARLLYLNYPNAPTGALATREFFEHAVAFARSNRLIIAQDAAYSELSFSARALSILQIPGARECSIEFHSLSKTFNMTGWRVGFAAGDARLIAGLGRVKSLVDAGVFTAIQRAGAEALRRYEEVIPQLVDSYRERRDTFITGLNRIGWRSRAPEATFYCWLSCPSGFSSEALCARLLDEADVVMVPGNSFGDSGQGFVRAALTVPTERLVEAVRRIGLLRITG